MPGIPTACLIAPRKKRRAPTVSVCATFCLPERWRSSRLPRRRWPRQEQQNPNILVIWGDDIGWYNISAYNLGLMGYRTPNIDRIASEGALFTDWYGQQSCTAGRAAFLTGQTPVRTGLTKVGLPGADLGLKEEDPTIAGLLKNQGYMTGPVRQEPSGRPRRAHADPSRLRRVLRQPLPPERRGGAGESRLSERPGVQGKVRAAGRDQVDRQSGWQRRRSRTPAR